MMKRRIANTWILAAFAFASLATAGFAQVHAHPGAPAPLHSAAPLPSPVLTAMPLPGMSMHPIPMPSMQDPNKSRYVGKVPAGTRVPLSRLPRRPYKSMMITLDKRALHGGRWHPMSASGATLTVTATAGCATGGTVGTVFNVGCQLSIVGNNMNDWSAGDTYEYFVITPNVTNVATAIPTAGCNPNPWTGTTGTTCSSASTTLSVQGSYQFLIYDTTQKVWVTSFYANAGQTFDITVYSDPFHTAPQYQFDTGSSGAAYVYLQNVATSGKYVMFVQSNGVNVYCAYMAPAGAAALPAPSPRPTGGASGNNLLCNTSTANVAGVNAPGGNLSLTWALSSSLEAGLYTVGIYDQNANGGTGAVLGTVQVSLTSGGAALLTTGSTTGMNASPAPFGPTGTNILAWNSTTDQSVGGIIATTQQVIPGLPTTYRWTVTDPDGQVMGTPVQVVLSSNGTLTNTFNFSAFPTLNPPGQYPSSVFGVQLYDTTAGNLHVIASQAMQLVGYHVSTQFIQGGVAESQINFDQTGPPEVVTADIKFTNDGNVYFGTGDSLSGIEFTEGPFGTLNAAFKPPPTYAGGGAFSGVTFALSAAAVGENCKSAAGCTENVTDSNGGAWTVTNYCSVQPSSSLGLKDQCVLTLLPTASGTTLPPGASIDIPAMLWYGTNTNGSWPCYSTPCFATTSILPTHGLSWSQTNNLANPTAWTPVSFGGFNSGLVLKGTMRFDYAGSRGVTGATCTGAPGSVQATQGAVPWLEGHFFQPAFTRGDYQVSTPYSLGAARCDVGSFLIKNNSTGGTNGIQSFAGFPEIAIDFPSYFTTSQITVDSNSTANWTKLACPAAFGSSTVCFNGPAIAGAGGTATLFLDIPLTISSFPFQEISVQAFSADQVYFPLTNDGTTTTAYGYQASPTFAADSLMIGSFSLNANLMTSAFTPSTVGSGQNPTPLTLVVGNTSTAADPNPDAIDEFVVEQTTNKNWTVNGVPTVTGPTGWANRATFNPAGNTMDYYFGVCAAQAVQADGPPQTTGTAIPLVAAYPSPPPCTAAQEQNALLPGQAATVNMNLNTAGGIAAGSYNFTVYAHGANSGGWSALKTFALNVNAESSSSGFQALGATCPGTTVPTNSLPTVSVAQNCFVYSLKNTSASASISKVDITIPAFDQSGLAATSWALVGPVATNVKVGTISGGVFTLAGVPAGCAVNAANTFNPVGGSTNGQIEITGCTGLTAGKILAVEFQATSPGSQSDTYDFPSTTDGISSSAAWIGDQSVQESFAIGLTVVVDPANPGPGGSTPVVSCTTCAFSGSTIDFGAVATGGNAIGTNVVRATVIYNGSTTGTDWQLSVGVSGTNPVCVGATCGGILNELLTDVDNTIAAGGHSNTKCGTLLPQQLALAAVPPSGAPLLIAKGTETACGGLPPFWDTIQNYKVQVGTEAAVGHTLTIIYTLVP